MKLPNLKTFDYKQLGIDHGEKVAIALIGLLLVFVLWTTKWSQPIKETPSQLIEDATATDEKIKTQDWPPNETKSLKTGTDLNERVASLLTPLDVKPWEMPIELNKPYHPDRTLISAPKWLAVKDLIADAQAVDVQMDPKVARLDENFKKLKKEDTAKQDKAKKADKKEKEPEQQHDEFEEFKRTSSAGAGGTGGFGFGKGFSGGGLNLGGGMGKGRFGGGQGGAVENQGRRQGRRGRKRGGEDNMAENSAAAAKAKEKEKPVGRGYHVVSVRGIFPLREQASELIRVMGSAVTRKDAQDLIQMHDYVLERQTALPGPDPWRGKWERVDRASTVEMFQSDILSFAPDPVLSSLVDNHICMPLPTRLIGDWGKLATHPDVNEFVLSPEEIQAQLEYQKKVIEKMRADEDKKHKEDDTGGFAPFTNNPRKVQQRGAAAGRDENSKPIQEQILDDLKKSAKERPSDADIDAKITDYITKHTSAQDHLLLFRYVDFNVEPGKIYRYRVKLVVFNPFHNRHAEEVSDPSLIEGEFRETAVSEPTRPVYVPEDAKFFVTHLDAHPGRSSLPWAKVDLYQWFASTGTVVNKEVIAQIGQLLGGKQIADVLNPAEGVLDKEWVPFFTNDALVDIAPGFSLEPGLHKELISEMTNSEIKDKADPKEKKASADKKTGTMVPDVLVFVDANGALRVIDGLDQEEDHQREKQRYAFQLGQWGDVAKPDEPKSKKAGRGRSKLGGRGGKMGGGLGDVGGGDSKGAGE
jgi:uncharacterized membrane protein YgcG